jgi:hypothetical protein
VQAVGTAEHEIAQLQIENAAIQEVLAAAAMQDD